MLRVIVNISDYYRVGRVSCTQVIVEKAYAGNMDHIRHAQDLFVDVLALFVRVLVLLLKNAAKKQQDEERTRRKRK